MPGLASKGRAEPERAVSPQPIREPTTKTTPAIVRERRTSTSNPAIKRYMDHVSHFSPVPKPEPIRTRTFSTPTADRFRVVQAGLWKAHHAQDCNIYGYTEGCITRSGACA
ncbi:unnamed protein product [Peniophora sp. CBMAI 1063]|nr:unnamed protein product [Peniophora sp. CBMAI 1063]